MFLYCFVFKSLYCVSIKCFHLGGVFLNVFSTMYHQGGRVRVDPNQSTTNVLTTMYLALQIQPKDITDTDSVRKAMGVGDIFELSRKALDDQEEMEVHLAAEAIETVFNETTTMEDLDKGWYLYDKDIRTAQNIHSRLF